MIEKVRCYDSRCYLCQKVLEVDSLACYTDIEVKLKPLAKNYYLNFRKYLFRDVVLCLRCSSERVKESVVKTDKNLVLDNSKKEKIRNCFKWQKLKKGVKRK